MRSSANDIDRAETEVKEANARIVSAFPSYAALSDPKPLSVAETQALLKPDEALIVILVGSSKSFLWAITRESTAWAQMDLDVEELTKEVMALRPASTHMHSLMLREQTAAGLRRQLDLQLVRKGSTWSVPTPFIGARSVR